MFVQFLAERDSCQRLSEREALACLWPALRAV